MRRTSRVINSCSYYIGAWNILTIAIVPYTFLLTWQYRFYLAATVFVAVLSFHFLQEKKWFALWMFCKWNNKCICIKRSEICVFVLFDKKNNLVLQKKNNVHVWVNRFVVFTLRTVRLKVCLLRGQDVFFV